MNGSRPINDQEVISWIRNLPKPQLHLHLEGSIPVEALWELSRKHNITFQAGSIDEFKRLFLCASFPEIGEAYLKILSLIQDKDDIRSIVAHLAACLRSEGVGYAELTVTPYVHISNGMSVDDLLIGLEQGRKQALSAGGPRIYWIFDFPRQISQADEITLKAALYGQENGVIGIGLAGREPGYPPRNYQKIFDTALSSGLVSIVHAGEAAGPEYVWEAINFLGASRIGHGIRAVEDPSLIEYLVEKKIPLEICPTSNIRMGFVRNEGEHPLRELWDKGVNCTLNSDDDLLFATNITKEYFFAYRQFGFTYAELTQINQNGFNAGIIDHTRL